MSDRACCRCPYLPQNTDVIVGDLLVSSGLGGVYPPGYPVAKVTAVVRDPGQPLLAVEAEPLAGLDRVPEVLLVWFDNVIVEPEPEADSEAPAPVPAQAPAPVPTQAPAQAPARETPQVPAQATEQAPGQAPAPQAEATEATPPPGETP